MSDLIEKLSDLRSQFNCFDENERDAYHTLSEAIKVLSEQTELCDDPRADVYYLAEKIGIHRLYALVVELRGEPEPCDDDKGCSNCMYSGRPTYKSPCAECRDNSQWEMKPISRSHENGTECEDAISRQDALDILDGLQIAHEQGEYSAYERYRQEMCAVPSVTPKRKTGKWIEYDSDEDKYDVIKCPCCKHTFTVDAYHWTDIGFVKDDFKFCPNCGADMNPLPEPYKPKEKNNACD